MHVLFKIKNVEQNKKNFEKRKKRGKNKKSFFTSLNHTIISVVKKHNSLETQAYNLNN